MNFINSSFTRRERRLCFGLFNDLLIMAMLHIIFYLIYSFIFLNAYTSPGGPDVSHLDMIRHGGGRQSTIEYEPGYPKMSRVHSFPTVASEKEMANHDRYLVHGILYTDMLTSDYLQKHWSRPESRNLRKVCMNIFVKNRNVPYINSLVMSLMGSHEKDEEYSSNAEPAGKRFLEYVEVNILDVERRPNKLNYDDMRRKVMGLPFLKLHSTLFHSTSETSQSDTNKDSSRLDKINDFIESSNICIQSGLEWCLIMEEFTVLPLDFLRSLQKFVIDPLDATFLETKATDSLSMVSLFSEYDSKEKILMDVTDIIYSTYYYETYRGKLNSERKALELDEYKSDYRIYVQESHTGGNAAMLFPIDVVKLQLLPFLQRIRKKEEKRLWWNDIKEYIGLRNTDAKALDLELEFPLYTGTKRRQVEPSLVNRIGFYDHEEEQYIQWNRNFEGGLVSNWITDPRFLFEPGLYQEGRDWYCQDAEGEWIYYDGCDFEE